MRRILTRGLVVVPLFLFSAVTYNKLSDILGNPEETIQAATWAGAGMLLLAVAWSYGLLRFLNRKGSV